MKTSLLISIAGSYFRAIEVKDEPEPDRIGKRIAGNATP
jgi:hypothetical protein